MVRLRLCAATIALLGLAVSADRASAQFGGLFGGPPPRPPSNVPGPPPGPPGQPLPSSTPQPQPGYEPDLRGSAAVQSQPLAPPGSIDPRSQASQPPIYQPSGPPGPPSGPPSRQPLAPAAAPQTSDDAITELPTQKVPNPTAVFAGLDKITGRIITFEAAINETVQFGALQVTPRACYTRAPTETPNTDAFIEVNEVTLQGEVKRIFGGWMFASSPGLHAIEHPIYDVWLTDCKGAASTLASTAPLAPTAPAPAAHTATAPTQSTQRQPPRQQARPLPSQLPPYSPPQPSTQR
jgi:hypothetical protein